MKQIYVSPAALAAARKINNQSLCDVPVSEVAKHIQEGLSPALPLLRILEVSLERGSNIVTDLTPVQRNLLEIDLANVRSTLHRLSPMNQEIQDHE